MCSPDVLSGGGGFNVSQLPYVKTSYGTCARILPSGFLRVNTIFEVARFAGLVTAYTGAHARAQAPRRG